MTAKKAVEDITLKATQNRRVVALDIIRGWFLIVILINHIELYPSGFDYLTGRGRLLVSAAEGFFFMSGLLVGMVYKRRLGQGMKFIFKKMWSRALQLYFASIFFTLLYTAAAVFLNHPSIKDGLYSVIDWPHIVKETLLMRYGYGWADFLDRFAILMIMAPLSFFLIAKRKWWLLMAISVVGWAFRGNGFTLSWQILFNLAMVIGFYWDQLTNKWQDLRSSAKRRIKRTVLSVTAVSFLFSYGSVYVLFDLNQKYLGLSGWLQHLTQYWNSSNAWIWLYSQKWTMGPFRIVLFMIWFAALFMFVQKYHAAINRFSCGLIELLGRNSLFVYIAHSVIVFAFRLAIPDQTTELQNFLITGSALALLIITTVVYKKIEPITSSWAHSLSANAKRPFLALASAK